MEKLCELFFAYDIVSDNVVINIGYMILRPLSIGNFGIARYATISLCCRLPFAFALIVFLSGAVGFSLYAVAYRDGMRKLKEKEAIR